MGATSGAVIYVWSVRQISTAWASDPSPNVIRDSEGRVAVDYTTQHPVSFAYCAGDATHEYESQLVLPDDQKVAHTLTSRTTAERHEPLEVIDLGQLRHRDARRSVHRRGWTVFPVLPTPDERTLVGSGAFTEKGVTEALSGGFPPSR
jgi:hypothetical protein